MNPKDRIFFIHIPKTGGISIEKSLERLTALPVCPAYNAESFFNLQQTNYGIYHGHLMYYTRDFIDPNFTFTILRDPIERAMSAFEHILRDKTHKAHGFLPESNNIISALSNPKLRVHMSNAMTLYLGLRPEFKKFKTLYNASHHALKHHNKAEVLENAKEAIRSIDYIGFTETLEANQLQLPEILGYSSPENFETTDENKNPNKATHTYREQLSSDILEVLIEANQDDIEIYKLAKEVARTQNWPHPEIYENNNIHKISISAEKKYFENLAAKPQVECIHYNFGMPLEGSGWYPRETNGNIYWRFTGPNKKAAIFFPKLSKNVRTLTLHILHAVTPKHLSELEVSINGVAVTDRTLQGTELKFSIPPIALEKEYTVIEFLTPPPELPASGDNRKLGIALYALEII